MKLIIKNSHIKGYHKYRIRPHEDILMLVKKEELNAYDPNAMVVIMPRLDEIPVALHNTMTKEAKGKQEAQYVRTIAGKTVGRLPANLGEVLRKLEDNIKSWKW